MSFSAGLEQFGTLGGLDWDREFEDLVSTSSTIEDDLDASDAMCTMDISTKTTESGLFSLEGDCDTDLVIMGSYQLAPTDEVISAEDTVMEDAIHPAIHPESPVSLPLEEEHSQNLSASQIFHLGQSEEMLSCTSPQVARWVMSPGIFNDIKWTMNACKNDVVDNNVPRIASSLLRAMQHVHEVPLDAGIGYPYGAYGEKVYERCLGPLHLFPRGAMGLKKPTDADVPKDVYVPKGIKILPPLPNGQAFYPRPSPLRYVANNDDNQPPKRSQSAPFLVSLSGENYLDEDVEMSQSMETREITIQEYEQESDQDAGEEIEFSSKEFIETHFEIEINDRTAPSNTVDQDGGNFYASSEESRSWPSSPPLPSRELDSPVIIYEDEAVGLINDETTYDLPELASAAHYKIPELGPAQDLDSSPFYSAYHASENFVEAGWSSLDEDSDECGPELPELDHITTTLNGDEIDQAISRLKSMSSMTLNELLGCKRESDISCAEYAPSTDGLPSIILPESPRKGADESFNLTSPSPMVVDLYDVPRARSARHANPIVGTDSGDAVAKAPPVVNPAQGLAKKSYSEGLQGSSQIAEGGVGIANVVGAICHTIWSICSANHVPVFLF